MERPRSWRALPVLSRRRAPRCALAQCGPASTVTPAPVCATAASATNTTTTTTTTSARDRPGDRPGTAQGPPRRAPGTPQGPPRLRPPSLRPRLAAIRSSIPRRSPNRWAQPCGDLKQTWQVIPPLARPRRRQRRTRAAHRASCLLSAQRALRVLQADPRERRLRPTQRMQSTPAGDSPRLGLPSQAFRPRRTHRAPPSTPGTRGRR